MSLDTGAIEDEITLFLEGKCAATLRALAAEQKLSLQDMMKRCVSTQSRLREERRKGNRIAIKKPDGEVTELII